MRCRLLAVLLLAPLVHAAQPAPAITGRVVSPDGTPVAGGTVVLLQSITSKVTSTIDRDGRFRIAADSSTPQQLVIAVPGFAMYRATVRMRPSRSVTLPDIRLLEATYVRARFVTTDGEVIPAGRLRQRSIDADGATIPDPAEHVRQEIDAEGRVTLGPLPPGRTLLAFDRAGWAQTRLPDVEVTDKPAMLDKGAVTITSGSRLNVDIVDANGVGVPGHDVSLEDAVQPSPLLLAPAKTNEAGRAVFDRLGAGRYRVWTRTDQRCAGVWLTVSRVISAGGSGTSQIRMAIGGQLALRVVSPQGPLSGRLVTASPDGPTRPPWVPQAAAIGRASTASPPGCAGSTDGDGRVRLAPFPPGPAQIRMRLFNSTFIARVSAPADGRDVPITIPDGLIAVKTLDATTRQPLSAATVVWLGGGGRVEAVTTGAGDALLEGVGAGGGTLTISARGYQPLEGRFTEPPAAVEEVALTPLPADRFTIRVTADTGDPVAGAVLVLQSSRAGDPVEFVTTDDTGAARFGDGLANAMRIMVYADGFVPATARVGGDHGGVVGITLTRPQ